MIFKRATLISILVGNKVTLSLGSLGGGGGHGEDDQGKGEDGQEVPHDVDDASLERESRIQLRNIFSQT